MGGVTASESGRNIDGCEPHHGFYAIAFTASVHTVPTGIAIPTGLEDLNGNPLTRLHTPTLRGLSTQVFHHADDLVARDKRVSAWQEPGVLLVVRTAQPARLHAQQPGCFRDWRHVERPKLKGSRFGEHEARSRGHATARANETSERRLSANVSGFTSGMLRSPA